MVKEIVTTFCFVGDFGWLRHLGVAEDNRDFAFLVSLYREGNIFSHFIIYFCNRMSDSCGLTTNNMGMDHKMND